MTDKYNIQKVEEKEGDELTITFKVKSSKVPQFELSINVPYNISKEDTLKRIHDKACNEISHQQYKKSQEDLDEINKTKIKNAKDKLKKDIKDMEDTDIDITG